MKNKPSINQRAKDFGKLLIPFLKEYGKETIREFYDYWIEHNANGKKMRFEMEKIFSISRRLATWRKHQEQWTFKSQKERNAEVPLTSTSPFRNMERFNEPR